MNAFQYRPLDVRKRELRILRLQPASWAADIELHLQHRPLHERPSAETPRRSLAEVQGTLPPGWTVYETLEGRYLFESGAGGYCSWTHPLDGGDEDTYSCVEAGGDETCAFEALSYTWGDDAETTPIRIVDVDAGKSGSLVVRPNLAAALRYLRYPDRERTLWIDALCIDQSNLEERGEQVKRMDQIYRLAKQVNVWLGAESAEDNSDQAMELLGYIGAQVEYTRDQSYLAAPSCREKNWFRPDIEIPVTDVQARAIQRLLQRAWFSRLWIWQEVQLANPSARLYCGAISIAWYHFRRAVLALDVKQALNPLLPVAQLAHVSNLVFSRSSSTASLKLLWATRHAQCHDERDRIYAILGLVQPRFSALVQPDYALTPAVTYQKACESWMRAYDKLSFLEFCDLPRQCDARPSWVPDWSRGLAREPMTFNRFASGESGTGGAYVVDGKVLEVLGVQCGVVTWVEDLDLRVGHGSWEYWRNLCKELQPCAGTHSTDEAHLDAFVALLCGNRIREMYPSHIYWPTLAECRNTLLTSPDQEPNRSSPSFNTFQNSVHEFTHGRRLFKTPKHIGFAPPAAAKGDTLTVLLGFDAPALLRAQSGSQHVFVGEAHAHGLMNGEAVLGALPTGWRAQSDRSKQGLMVQMFAHDEPAELTCADPRLDARLAECEAAGGHMSYT
ncbi:HET-domain-containing protein [Lizonia empirigonia]|nr:HET-domain-containing protein [Lizonia empirigonia]